MKNEVTIKFPSKELMDEFSGWFLDGGGEQGFMDAVEMRTGNMPQIDSWGDTKDGYEIIVVEGE